MTAPFQRPAPVKPVRVATAHDLALAEIRTALALARFAPGDALPKERDLANMLSLSRVTVRGVLAVLSSEGLIDVRRGRGGGAFVTQHAAEVEASPERREEQREKLRRIFEFRAIIESAAATRAAERRSEAELARLRELVHRMQLLVDDRDGDAHDVVELIALDHEFHIGIARATGNEHLADAVQAVRVEMFRPIGSVFARPDPEFNDVHAQIVDAITERAGALAAKLMEDHVLTALSRLESMLDESR